MLLAIDGDLIGAIVDGLCGATAPHPFERYELSAMEARIGKQMIDLALTEIQDTLQPFAQLNLTPIAYEHASGMLAIADGQDWMIAVTGIFDTAFGTGTIKLIVPYDSFEPLEAKFSTSAGLLSGRGADAGWIAAVEMLAETTPVHLRVELARAAVPLALVEAILPGTVLPFFLSAEAFVLSGNVELFRAEYGQSSGFMCCRVKAEDAVKGEVLMPDQKERLGAAGENERVELERLSSQPRGAPAIGARNVLDRVQVALTVELGRTQITVKDLRQLRHGQVVTLDQMVGEPLTIFANGQKLAYGEVVAVANDHYGVRVTALAEDADASEEGK
jgi:flagellar motor switch protein FliN